MGLLRPAVAETAYYKGAYFGFAASGKTLNAFLTMAGMRAFENSDAPIAMFDTEDGSDFLLPQCDRFGVPRDKFLVAKTRSFKDLMQFLEEAGEAGARYLIVDSITHVWDELKEAYERAHRRRRGLEIWDWGKIKPEFRQFTDKMLAMPMHIVTCGRAAWEYETQYDEAKDKNETIRAGQKLRAEGEFGFEPHFTLRFDRVSRALEFPNEKGRKGLGEHVRVGVVLKDRSTILDGHRVVLTPEALAAGRNDLFEFLRPSLAALNIGGEHRGVDTTSSSEAMFGDGGESYAARSQRVKVVTEEIGNLFKLAGYNTRKEADQDLGMPAVIRLWERHFGVRAWAALTHLSLEQLEAGARTLARHLKLDPAGPNEGDVYAMPTDQEVGDGLVVYQEPLMIEGGRPAPALPDPKPDDFVELTGAQAGLTISFCDGKWIGPSPGESQAAPSGVAAVAAGADDEAPF